VDDHSRTAAATNLAKVLEIGQDTEVKRGRKLNDPRRVVSRCKAQIHRFVTKFREEFGPPPDQFAGTLLALGNFAKSTDEENTDDISNASKAYISMQRLAPHLRRDREAIFAAQQSFRTAERRAGLMSATRPYRTNVQRNIASFAGQFKTVQTMMSASIVRRKPRPVPVQGGNAQVVGPAPGPVAIPMVLDAGPGLGPRVAARPPRVAARPPRVVAGPAARRRRRLAGPPAVHPLHNVVDPKQRRFLTHANRLTRVEQVRRGFDPRAGMVHMVGMDTNLLHTDDHMLKDVYEDSNKGMSGLMGARRGPFRGEKGRSRILSRSAHVTMRKRQNQVEITIRRGVTTEEINSIHAKLGAHTRKSPLAIIFLVARSKKKIGSLRDIDLTKLMFLIQETLVTKKQIGILLVDNHHGGVLHRPHIHTGKFTRSTYNPDTIHHI
jgi:hypothetical protein